MEFFDIINQVVEIPNTVDQHSKLVKLVNRTRNEKYINYKDNKENKLNKSGYYILRNLMNHKLFYDRLPNTPLANEFKQNGLVVIKNVKVNNENISNVENIYKELFGFSNCDVILKKSKLSGPHKDRQNQLHMDRPHPTIKWFLYLNDVTKKNGAFCYSKGSHIPTLEKLRFLYKVSCMNNKNKLLDEHLDNESLGAIRVCKNNVKKELARLQEMKFEPFKSIEGKKYTLIIADTSGFHKRGILEADTKRHVLFNGIGYPKWSDIFKN